MKLLHSGEDRRAEEGDSHCTHECLLMRARGRGGIMGNAYVGSRLDRNKAGRVK